MSNTNDTFALVFVKARSEKVGELNPTVMRLKEKKSEPEERAEVVRIFACAGYFDACVLLRGSSLNALGDFVMNKIRQELKELIADTETIVCWEISG